jgi:hypothetical protein
MKMNIIKIVLLLISLNAFAEDLGHTISGASVKDSLGELSDGPRLSPHVDTLEISNQYSGNTNKKDEDVVFGNNPKVLDKPLTKDLNLKSNGYLPPGTLENQKNYLELDKKIFAKDFRYKATSAFTFSYISDSFNYESQNDIINKTISEGYRHIKSGLIQVRSDQYFFKTFALNGFWSAGTGLSYNSGRGTFVTGDKSETKFTLWEMPLDLGIGLELPIYYWFKIVGTAGPSGMILSQNRSDFADNEKGKNKFQFGYGQFAQVQFRMNLTALSDHLAYDLFSSSQITTLSMNLEARYQNYKKFQDPEIAISGTSVGIGFTFEFL